MRSSGSLRTRLFILGTAVSLVAAACGSSNTPAPSLAASTAPAASSSASSAPAARTFDDVTIRWVDDEPTQGLDPAIATTGASLDLMSNLYDTLMDYDPTGKLVPWLAQSVTASTDGLTWTIKLQPSARFSDGSQITANDVKFSLDRARNGAVLKGQMSLVTAINVVDPATVTIALSKPDLELPIALAAPGSAGILSQTAVAARPDYFTMPTVTSGPYTVTELVPQSHATLVANAYYWNPALPKAKTIQWIYNSDATVRQTMVVGGAADIGESSSAGVQQLGTSPQFTVVQTTSLAPIFFGWDWTAPPFDNVLVRQAFGYAIDREGTSQGCQYTDASIYGAGPLANDPNYAEIDTYKVDRATALAKAGQLLDQAGWKMGSNGVRVASGVKGVADGTPFAVTVPYENTWVLAQCDTLLLQQTMKQVGVTITPDAWDRSSFYSAKNAGASFKGVAKFTMYHGGAWATDAVNFFDIWYHSGGALTGLTTHLNDPTIDSQIDAVDSGTDPATVKTELTALQQMAATNLYVLIFQNEVSPVIMIPNLTGYFTEPSGSNARPLMYVDFKH